MTSMAEAEVHTLTGAYVCDALGEDERTAFEAHMASCPDCAAEVRELREVAAIMAEAVAERPPASLKAAVDARIEVTRQSPPLTPPSAAPAVAAPGSGAGSGPALGSESRPGSGSAPSAPRRRLRAGWAVAAALALLAAGLGWRAIDQQHRINALDAQATQISRLLAAPDAYTVRVPVTGGGSALIVDSRSRNEAAVTFTGLSQAPAGKSYQLWLMTADGSARSVGVMQAAPDTPVLVQGLTGEADVGMTVEPAGGSVRPTTSPVMVAALGA
jgi:anti-sigma-K factor RskA